jgi:pre-mRNA-splicing factor SYF1
VQEAIDASYEEDIRRNPFSLNNWRYYLVFKSDAPRRVRYAIYDRALSHLPRSYKLWVQYLEERVGDCAGVPVTAPIYADVNALFERALIHMHKMPVVWRMFLDFLIPQRFITSTRRNFDRALRALPLTQHAKWVWPSYIRFADSCGVPETAMRVWRRFIRIAPNERESFVDALLAADQVDAAAVQMAAMVNDENFVSQRGKSRHELWSDLLRLLVPHAARVSSLDVEAVIRSGIRRYPHEVARLWNALADVFTRQGLFDRARSVYAEALAAVVTVRDFALVYNAYMELEEGLIEGKVAELDAVQRALARARSSTGPDANADANADDGDDDGDSALRVIRARLATLSEPQLAAALQATEDELDLRMMRLERLVSSRPLLVNSVLLRQNPHNVTEWLNRVKLCGGDAARVVETFEAAVATVDPALAEGQAQNLWHRFAAVYERRSTWDGARAVYERGVTVPFRTPDALAFLWLRYAEMELAAGRPRRAIALLEKATTPPADYRRAAANAGASAGTGGAPAPAQALVYKDTRLWGLLADLQESVGSLDAVRAVYDRMLQLRVMTPAALLNYTALLEGARFYEEAFRAYEKGVAAFPYPAVAPVWVAYLRRFTDRYGGAKLERARDLFEQALAATPAEFLRPLFLLYAQYEERVGTPRALMHVLARACASVPPAERLELYLVYLVKASECYGAVRTREIFDAALQAVPDAALPLLGTRYAALERRLGEIDRARGVYTYVAQFSDPRTETGFWATFHRFEMLHGNEDTFKDMLRVRRAVKAQCEQSSLVSTALAQAAQARDEIRRQTEAAAAAAGTALAGAGGQTKRPLETATAAATVPGGIASGAAVAAAAGAAPAAVAQAARKTPAANPDEIDLGFDDDDDDNDDNGGNGGATADGVVQLGLPATLFGGLANKGAAAD